MRQLPDQRWQISLRTLTLKAAKHVDYAKAHCAFFQVWQSWQKDIAPAFGKPSAIKDYNTLRKKKTLFPPTVAATQSARKPMHFVATNVAGTTNVLGVESPAYPHKP